MANEDYDVYLLHVAFHARVRSCASSTEAIQRVMDAMGADLDVYLDNQSSHDFIRFEAKEADPDDEWYDEEIEELVVDGTAKVQSVDCKCEQYGQHNDRLAELC